MKRGAAPAKINLALVVGPRRPDGKHELVDRLPARRARATASIVAQALAALASTASPTTRSSAAPSRRSPRRRAPAALRARRSRSGSRSPPGSAAAAPTRRPRSAWRTSCSTSRLPTERLHDLAARARRRRPVLPARRARSSARATARSSSRSTCRRTTGSSSCSRDGARSRRRRRLRRVRRARRRARLRRAARRTAAALAACPAPARPRALARRTTSPRRRSRTSCGRSARSAPTSRAPGRPSTASSCTGTTRARRERADVAPGAHLAHGTCVVPLTRGVHRAEQPAVIEAGSTRAGRWLARAADQARPLGRRRRRVFVVAATATSRRWTVLVIAVIVLAFYMLAGRNIGWDVARQLSWIAAASQALAILVVLLAFVLRPSRSSSSGCSRSPLARLPPSLAPEHLGSAVA